MRTIKKQGRYTVYSLPFKRILREICRAIVEKAVNDLNQFPAKDDIYKNTSTISMMTGRPFPDYNILVLEFGTFVHISEDNSSINTTKSRTTSSIALNKTRNVQVCYCLSLVIRFILDRQK